MTSYKYELSFEDVQVWEARRELNEALAASIRIEQSATAEHDALLQRETA